MTVGSAILFRTIVEQSPTSTQVFAPDGTMLLVNAAWERLWGVSVEQLRDYNILEDEQLVAKGIMPYIERAFAGETVSIPPVKYEPDQTRPGISTVAYRWVTACAYPILDESGAVAQVVLMHEDITEQTRAEEQLRAAEAQYRAIFQASSDGLIISDLDGIVVEVNPALCQMLGYSHDELVGVSPLHFIHPGYRHLLPQYYQAIESGSGHQIQGLLLRKDGRAFPTEVHGTTFIYAGTRHHLGVVRDISERVQVEDRMREAEAQYHAIFEATSDGLIINDPTRGVVVEANPAVCQMHGYTYEEFIGLHGTAFIHPDYHAVFADFVTTITRGGTFQTEAIDLRKDGSLFYVEVHGSSVLYDGRPHILAVVRDTTERVQARELLEQRVAERTRELSTLLDVSHNVASTLELQPLIDVILDQLQSVAEYSGARIFALEGDEGYVTGYRGPLPPDLVLQHRYPIGPGNRLWRLLERHEPFIIPDVCADTPFARTYHESIAEHSDANSPLARSVLCVPLALKERLVGALLLEHDVPGHYTPRHAALAMAIGNQAAIAIENARLYERAQEVAALEERARLARELHDSVSQALYGIALGAHTAQSLLERDPTLVAEPVGYILSLAEAGLAEMRALIFELLPEALERDGLVAAIDKQVTAVRARHKIAIRERLGTEPEAPLAVKEALYRITQEALHNVVKHARARTVEIDLKENTVGLILEIRDDGCGFDTDSAFPGHLGLHTMRQRAARLGGTLEIRSVPGAGAHIRAQVPSRRPVTL